MHTFACINSCSVAFLPLFSLCSLVLLASLSSVLFSSELFLWTLIVSLLCMSMSCCLFHANCHFIVFVCCICCFSYFSPVLVLCDYVDSFHLTVRMVFQQFSKNDWANRLKLFVLDVLFPGWTEVDRFFVHSAKWNSALFSFYFL